MPGLRAKNSQLIMPYKSRKIKISGTKYDRRQKLSPQQKDEIRHLYYTTETSQRKLAKQFGVSRRLIIFVLDQERYEHNRERLKAKKSKGFYRQSKEQLTTSIREHRRYKQQLYLQGNIKLETTNPEIDESTRRN